MCILYSSVTLMTAVKNRAVDSILSTKSIERQLFMTDTDDRIEAYQKSRFCEKNGAKDVKEKLQKITNFRIEFVLFLLRIGLLIYFPHRVVVQYP